MIIRRNEYPLLDKTAFGRVEFNPPFKASSPLVEEARLMHVVRGRSKLHFPNGQLELSSGDTIIMKCENFLNSWYENENNESSEAVIMHFYPDVLTHIYDGKIPDYLQFNGTVQPKPVEKIEPNEMMDNYIGSLRFYIDNAKLVNPTLIKLKYQELIHILVSTDKSGEIKSLLGSLFKSETHEFQEVIRTHLFEDLRLEDLAFLVGQSLSTFKRKFQSIYGTSPATYIRTQRLEKAKELLENQGDIRISEVAYDTGFNDLSYFSKLFTSTYSVSPSEYRKHHLSQNS
jgi:AraC-like DNA-binding protein